MNRSYHIALMLLLSILMAAQTPPTPTMAQDMAAITVINDSEERICVVQISAVTNTTWGRDWLDANETIRPGQTRVFSVEMGTYHIRLSDCGGNKMLTELNRQIDGDVELRFTGVDPSLRCEEMIRAGMQLNARSRYSESLEQFEAALVCSIAAKNRALEGATRNNIGLVYESQGRYEEALREFEAALAIRLEVGDRAGEGTTRNNSRVGLRQAGAV